MTIQINRKEDKRVTLSYEEKDANDATVMSLEATIGTGMYDAGSYNRTIINKQEYFGNVAKYKAIEDEFEAAYQEEAIKIYGGAEASETKK